MRLIIFLLFCCQICWAQNISLKADKTEILIGDHINMTATVSGVDMELERIDFNSIDTSKHFDLIDAQDIKTGSKQGEYIQEFTITSFDTGAHYFPSLNVEVVQSGMKIIRPTNRIPIIVRTVFPDSIGLAPLKDIILEESTWKDYCMLFVIPIILLLLGWVLWQWKKSADSTVEYKEIEVYVPPYNEAMSALSDLEARQLWQSGQIKEYEVSLSAIFRKYLERQFKFPALEWTTREITQHLSKSASKTLPLAVIDEVLRQSDMIKFAKAEPGPEVYQRQMDRVRECINFTKDIVEEEE